MLLKLLLDNEITKIGSNSKLLKKMISEGTVNT